MNDFAAQRVARALRACRSLAIWLLGLVLALLSSGLAARSKLPVPAGLVGSLYPRVLVLRHSGSAYGQLVASVTSLSGNQGLGLIYHSKSGKSFHLVGIIRDPAASHNFGLCCSTLYQLPIRIGRLPAGTLLWAASVGQNVSVHRRMSIDIWESQDLGKRWKPLSRCATAANSRGIWEPQFSVDRAGDLVCYFSDETSPRHSQRIAEVRSKDGVHWGKVHAVVAASAYADRPGMPVVLRVSKRRWLMSYEVCTPSGIHACAAHLRSSRNGWNWGDPRNLGKMVVSRSGLYFNHAPTLQVVRSGGKTFLLLIGEVLHQPDGHYAPGNGKTIFVNAHGGRGTWTTLATPVAVTDASNDPCTNYSSVLVALRGRLLELASDYDLNGVCRTYFASEPLQLP